MKLIRKLVGCLVLMLLFAAHENLQASETSLANQDRQLISSSTQVINAKTAIGSNVEAGAWQDILGSENGCNGPISAVSRAVNGDIVVGGKIYRLR